MTDEQLSEACTWCDRKRRVQWIVQDKANGHRMFACAMHVHQTMLHLPGPDLTVTHIRAKGS